MARPETIAESAQIAHDLILSRTGGDTVLADLIRRSIHDAYRTGANRALEAVAVEFNAIDRTEFTPPGHWGPFDAAELVRSCKFTPEESS